MDSLTQMALGATVSVAVMGKRTSVLKAAAIGAFAGTLPDLDILIKYGDPVSDMTFHRTESHAFFYQTLLAPLLAWLVTRLDKQRQYFWHWTLALWLVLLTHSLLDAMTVYGTQFALPFSDYPFGVGSIFIIDPLYTLPLLLGLGLALYKGHRYLKANITGIIVSSGYLLWSVLAQQHVSHLAAQNLQQQQIDAQQVLVTPTALNTVLWRILVMTPDGYAEGFYSLLDQHQDIKFTHVKQDTALLQQYLHNPYVQRLVWFSHGFVKLEQHQDKLHLTDLRMGQEGSYFFRFIIDPVQHSIPIKESDPREVGKGLSWLWPRLKGEDIPSPYLIRQLP